MGNQLEAVAFSGDENIEVVLDSVASQFHNLESISFVSSIDLTAQHLNKLGQSCKNLKRINFEDCQSLTDVGIERILRHCSGIMELTIDACESLTDSSLDYVGRYLLNIEKLSALELKNITELKVEELLNRCNKMKIFQCTVCTECPAAFGITEIF